MTTRLTTRSVNFVHPFTLKDEDDAQPAGTYIVETEEELLDSASFAAWRRVSSVIQCPAPNGITRYITIDPVALDAALERDARGGN